MQLQPLTYTQFGVHETGFFAQDVAAIPALAHAASPPCDSVQWWTLTNEFLLPHAIASIQELTARVTHLENLLSQQQQ